MKSWNEIKNATLDKLFLKEDEAQQEMFLEKMEYLANEALSIIANDFKENICEFEVWVFKTQKELDNSPAITIGEKHLLGSKIKMPSDFISYDNEVIYEGESLTPEIEYVGRNKIKVSAPGKYTITYNAQYLKIDKDAADLHTDPSVLYCLPSYIASQLLSQNDPQRSAILKNEFELLAARLDNNVLYDNQSFKSKGGWY